MRIEEEQYADNNLDNTFDEFLFIDESFWFWIMGLGYLSYDSVDLMYLNILKMSIILHRTLKEWKKRHKILVKFLFESCDSRVTFSNNWSWFTS